MTLGPDRITRYRWLMLDSDKGDASGNNKGDAASDDSGDDSSGDDSGDDSDESDDDSDDSDDDADDADDDKPLMTAEEVKAYKAKLRKSLAREIKAEIQAEADTDAAKKQGDYKKLYETATADNEKLKAQIEADNLTRIREKVGAEFNLPQSVTDLLPGKTEKEIRAKAKAMAEDLKIERKAPDNESGRGGGGGSSTKKKTRSTKRTYAFQKPGDVSWERPSD